MALWWCLLPYQKDLRHFDMVYKDIIVLRVHDMDEDHNSHKWKIQCKKESLDSQLYSEDA